MFKRYAISMSIVAATGTAALAITNGAADAQAQTRPNILVIVSDEARPDTLSVMPKTLRLMMRYGRRYQRAYTTTPLGNPSRAGLMSGLYAHNIGVRKDGDAGRLDRYPGTLQAYLHRAGYRTALFGKYLNSWADPRSGVSKPSWFDRWAAFTGSVAYYDALWNVQGITRRIPEYSTTYIGDRAVDWLHRLQNNDSQPWFMMLGTSAAQVPFTAEPRYQHAAVSSFRLNPARTERDRSDKPPYVRRTPYDLARDGNIRAAQLRTFMSVDDMVARVFGALRRDGEGRNTLVIYTSDHGFQWGEHGLTFKGTPYPAAYRVPLLVHWYGHFPENGARLTRPAANVDIAPTILEAAGIRPDPAYPMDGHSLLHRYSRSEMFLEFWKGGGGDAPPWASIRTARYQYSEYYRADGSVSFHEYYRADDVYQLHNLLHDGNRSNNPPVKELHALLAATRNCSPGACP